MSFVFFLMLLGFSMPSYAGSQRSSDALLQTLQLHQKKIPIRSKFKQVKLMKGLDIEIHSEGELEVKDATHAVWKILKPSYFSVEISPQDVRIYSSPSAPPRIIKKAASESSQMEGGAWIHFLMEKPELVVEHFDVSLVSPQSFRLKPLKSDQGFDFIELSFADHASLSKVYIQENKEDSLSISFTGK
ncbi:MAG: hypothetical protein R3A80_04075 [Bdellovibrionota bacterium]